MTNRDNRCDIECISLKFDSEYIRFIYNLFDSVRRIIQRIDTNKKFERCLIHSKLGIDWMIDWFGWGYFLLLPVALSASRSSTQPASGSCPLAPFPRGNGQRWASRRHDEWCWWWWRCMMMMIIMMIMMMMRARKRESTRERERERERERDREKKRESNFFLKKFVERVRESESEWEWEWDSECDSRI